MNNIQGTIPEVLNQLPNEPWAQDIRTSCENLNISKMKYPVQVIESQSTGWQDPKSFHNEYGKWAYVLCSSQHYMDTETPNYAILTQDIVGSSLIIVQHTNPSWMDKLYFSFLRILHRTSINLYRMIPKRK